MTGAYLCAPINDTEEVIMEIGRDVLYGLIQSALLWYRVLTGYLRENGFTANPIDPCVMNTMRNGKQLTVVIYVDDLLSFAEEEES